MLELRNLVAGYGAIRVLHEVNLNVARGELVAVIGPNGAGKSTTLRAIMGLCPPSSGDVVLEGESISRLGPAATARRGVALVPEGRRIFPGLTVLENLQIALAARSDGAGFSEDLDRVFNLFPRLARLVGQQGWMLSGGEQQMLAIGRAMVARPRVMLLDEPSLGLAPSLMDEMFTRLQRINEEGTTVLLVDQNAYAAIRLASRVFVLQNGRVVHHGSAVEMEAEPKLLEAYLGRSGTSTASPNLTP